MWLEGRGWWSEDKEKEVKERLKGEVMKAFKRAEGVKRGEVGELFTDVYEGEQPWNLVSAGLVFFFLVRVGC